MLLSGAMEALQTYLPTRVASNLDLAANALGALRAALVAPATGALLDRGALRRLRFAWFEDDGATPLLLAGLWPFAILFPSPFLFGIGDWPAARERADVSMQDALLAWLPAAWRVGEWPERVDGWLSDSGWEAALGGLMLFAALTIASLAMRPRAPRIRLLIALVIATLVLKAAATFMQSATGLVVVWATPGARLGIGSASRPRSSRCTCRRPGARRLRRAAGRRGAREPAAGQSVLRLHAVGLAAGSLRALQQPARWLAWIWPYAALIWLGQRVEHAWLPAVLRR